MTTESNHNDPRVSEAYQGLATETTSPELDHKILAMAATKPRPRYGLARVWIRPVAWAATIGLSLAIVLEISQLQHETSPLIDADEPAALQLSVPAAKQASSPPAAAEAAPARDVELATDNVSVSSDSVTEDMSLLREAEEQARSRSGPEPTAAAAADALSFHAAARLDKKEQVRDCDPDMRSSAETWYACIEDLRAEGRTAAADRELLLLVTEFPDFEE